MFHLVVISLSLLSVSEGSQSVLATLPAFPTGPTVFPGYVQSNTVYPLTPLMSGQTLVVPVPQVQPHYSNSTLDSLHPEMSSWLLAKQQSELKQGLCAPLLSKNGEMVPTACGYRLLSLRVPPFAQRDESVLFHARTNPFEPAVPAVVKYQTDCMERFAKKSQVHPLLKEFFLMKYIHEHSAERIVPKPFFVSPPVRMGVTRTPKNDFSMPESFWEKCAPSHVRYFVMESAGLSLEDIISFSPNFTLPFVDGMNVLRQIFSALKIIHNLGIVHGDIHRGNIVRSLQDGSKILLIDFGLARFVGNASQPLPEEPYRDGSKIAARMHFSHWKYQGYMASYRDDVMGALILVAQDIGGVEFITSLTEAEERDDREFFKSLYSSRDIFMVPQTGTSIVDEQLAYLDIPSREMIKAHLREIQSHVRALSSVNAIPPHDALIEIVDQILGIL